LAQVGAVDVLFEGFTAPLSEHGYQLSAGTLVDATMVPFFRQRNRRDEDGAVKKGRILVA